MNQDQKSQAAKSFIEESRKVIDSALLQWEELQEVLISREEEMEAGNILSELEFYEEAEAALARVFSDIERLQALEADSQKIDRSQLEPAIDQEFFESLQETHLLLEKLSQQVEEMEESEEEFRESILERCQKRLTHLSDALLSKKNIQTAQQVVQMDLDAESELEEIRGSLESIRQIRLEVASEEDDELLSILDSLITSCDSTLLIEESS
ncbi:MAG: hypothetical protein K0S07_1327 [Chlamydiales bacterium]|jgi:tetratricopeptide (TPR) repeat protein|nr:hypothetical protein [Chlamydiales bacterium]